MNIDPTFMKPENRFREMINLNFVFQPCVFSPSEDNEFPKGEFINPEKAKALLGNYKIDVVFYSKDFKIVDTAKDLGRYGAVVKITAQDGIE